MPALATDVGPRGGHAAAAFAAVLLTVVPGFVAMALLGSLRSYPAHLPGFWDYPSGTIGDALLVPTVIAALLVQVMGLSSEMVANEKPVALLAALVGFLGGAAVPLSWLLGPDTQPFWMLPRAHHFVLAGWVHAVYLSCATATIASLAVVCFRRLHAAQTRCVCQNPTAMTLAVGAGVGMLVLIGRDGVNGGFTLASAVTMGSLVVILVALLLGLNWAVGRDVVRSQWRATVVIVGFMAGLVAIIVHWLPHEPLLVGIAAVIGFLAAFPATSAFSSCDETSPYRYPTTIAMTALLTGGLVRSADAIYRHEPWPLAWLIGGVLLATVVLGLVAPTNMGWRRVVGFGLFLTYCIFLSYLGERLEVTHATAGSAGASLFVADMAFDVLVISLVQTRFGDLGKADQTDIEDDYLSEKEHAANPSAYLSPPSGTRSRSSSPDVVTVDVSLLGLAVAIGLLTLLAIAAKPLGLNRHTLTPPTTRLVLVAALAALGLILAAWVLSLNCWRSRTPDRVIDKDLKRLQLPGRFWVAPLLGASCWIAAAATMSEGSPREPLVASLGALLALTLYSNALIADTTTLQMLKATRAQRLVVVAVGLAIATTTFWLLGFGIWHDDRPVSAGWFAATAFAVFVGNSLVYGIAAYSLAIGLPKGEYTQQRQLSRRTVIGYLGLDAAIFGVVAGVGLSIPAYAAVRDTGLHVSPLNIVASLVFMPGFVGAVVWGLKNWQRLEQLEQRSRKEFGIPRMLLRLSDGDWDQADSLDAERRAKLRRNLGFESAGIMALVALGLLTLAAVLLR